MTTRRSRSSKSKSKSKSTLAWEEPSRRPTPVPLSREAILRAAIAIADREGLEAVSLRNVGAALQAGPMRLYGFVATKEQLLDRMVDEVYAEMHFERSSRDDWRTSMRAMARRMRHSARKHPWFVDLLGGRPRLGPNALEHLEASLAILKDVPGFDDVDVLMQAVATVQAYVLGALRNEESELHAERQTGKTESEWQQSVAPYIERMLATERFPTIARVVREATHPSLDVVFDEGLECVLDGVEARFMARRGSTKKKRTSVTKG